MGQAAAETGRDKKEVMTESQSVPLAPARFVLHPHLPFSPFKTWGKRGHPNRRGGGGEENVRHNISHSFSCPLSPVLFRPSPFTFADLQCCSVIEMELLHRLEPGITLLPHLLAGNRKTPNSLSLSLSQAPHVAPQNRRRHRLTTDRGQN